MIFLLKNWDIFCKDLALKSICAKNVFDCNDKYIVLKHDVETKVKKAYRMAKIESKYDHCGSYYVQAYLLNNSKNVKLLKEMQDLGHEISYHYDVMDSCNGNIDAAETEFKKNLSLFQGKGFNIKTVCQHGNPIINRKGYTSNRDFFRNSIIQSKYFDLCDIMVDFKVKANTQFHYFSDAGRNFKLIFDPINNDIINSDEKNIAMNSFFDMIEHDITNNRIISVHPHRWTSSIFIHIMQNLSFGFIKFVAKTIIKIPGAKKIMSRFYYLAKKI